MTIYGSLRAVALYGSANLKSQLRRGPQLKGRVWGFHGGKHGGKHVVETPPHRRSTAVPAFSALLPARNPNSDPKGEKHLAGGFTDVAMPRSDRCCCASNRSSLCELQHSQATWRMALTLWWQRLGVSWTFCTGGS